jgi:hypothetical protein
MWKFIVGIAAGSILNMDREQAHRTAVSLIVHGARGAMGARSWARRTAATFVEGLEDIVAEAKAELARDEAEIPSHSPTESIIGTQTTNANASPRTTDVSRKAQP